MSMGFARMLGILRLLFAKFAKAEKFCSAPSAQSALQALSHCAILKIPSGLYLSCITLTWHTRGDPARKKPKFARSAP